MTVLKNKSFEISLKFNHSWKIKKKEEIEKNSPSQTRRIEKSPGNFRIRVVEFSHLARMSKNLLALKKRRRKFLELEKGIVILERLLITRLRELSLPRLSKYSNHVISLRWRIGFVGVLFSPEKRAERFRKVVENRKERKLLVQRHIAN